MTYSVYVIALTITFVCALINIACCIIDSIEFRKLQKRVKALEEDKK